MPHPENITSKEDEALILDSIDRFLERDVIPYAHDLEAADEYPQAIADKMAELGLYGATISTEYGGLGLSATTYTKIVDKVSAAWMSVSGLFNAHLIMAQAVERAGTEEQQPVERGERQEEPEVVGARRHASREPASAARSVRRASA